MYHLLQGGQWASADDISSSRRSWAFWAHWPVTMDNAQWNVPHPQFYSGGPGTMGWKCLLQRQQWTHNGATFDSFCFSCLTTNLSFVNSPNKFSLLFKGWRMQLYVNKNKTEILSDDALVWTTVQLNWIELIDLKIWFSNTIISYLIVANFMRYFTGVPISQSHIFDEILPGSWYLIDLDFMRYFTSSTIGLHSYVGEGCHKNDPIYIS